MEKHYNFYNRENEIKQLLSSFEEIADSKQSNCYIIQGKKNIGKTTLIEEFVKRISKDVRLRSKIPGFDFEKIFFNCSCDKSKCSPYDSLIEITDKIKKRKKFIKTIFDFVKVILAVFGVNDLLNALNDFQKNFNEEKDAEKIQKKETQIFNQYKRFIKKSSSGFPLIIFLQNIQWIDVYSLKLIFSLISEKNNFWGMIILEYDDLELRAEIEEEINSLIQIPNVNQLNLFSLDKAFPSKMLSKRFGEDFFTSEENEVLYTVSEGAPGKLVQFIDNCINTQLLVNKDGKWHKSNKFLENIKPVDQKLLELIVSLYEDLELSEGELQMIKRMSDFWGISDSTVSFTVNMVKDIMDSGFNISQILGSGIFSKNCFLCYKNNSKFILEYIKVKENIEEEKYKRREIENNYLIEAAETKICSEGILLIWDYYDGKKSREFLLKAFAKHLENNLLKFSQLSNGLAELHRNNIVHGFIKPETVIETFEGKYKLASFDPWFIKYIDEDYKNEDSRENILYLSPEQLQGKEPTKASDIYSLGILFYKSLTNKFPFHGLSKNDLLDSIKNDKLELNSQFSQLFPENVVNLLKKATNFLPEERFVDAEEFNQEINKIRPEPVQPPLPPPPSPTPSKIPVKPVLISVLVVAFCIIGYFLVNEFRPEKKFEIENNITLSFESVNQTSEKDHLRMIQADVIEFLIKDAFLRNNRQNAITRKQFDIILNSSQNEAEKVPAIEITGDIITRDFDYELDYEIVDRVSGKKEKDKILFNDPSELISTGIFKIVKETFNTKISVEPVTSNWDAFISYFNGENNWSILDKTRAKNNFKRAIIYDPEFLLPKLGLANIYQFEGNNEKALELIQEIKLDIGDLSLADSIRTIALENSLLGRQREVIKNYRALSKYMPAQKEIFYELAEAYFNIREIDRAMLNYDKALDLDPEFSLALNHYAYCYSHTGNHKEALTLFKKYVSLDSSANSFDSYGDGFFSAGQYDSARYFKNLGLEIDPELDYLYTSLCYINIESGKINDARENISKYLQLQVDSELISNGIAISAFIDYSVGNYQNVINKCLEAKEIFDSKNLISRNHVMHWLLAKSYYKLNQINNFNSEFEEMEDIIKQYNIDENNYNEIFKFYNDLKFAKYCRSQNSAGINEISNMFDISIHDKIKDWSSPFDLAFFNTEFAIELLNNGFADLAKTRLEKALDYNPNYARAHYYLYKILKDKDDLNESEKHLNLFGNILKDADKKYLSQFD